MKILKNIKLLCALLCIAALYSCDKYLDIQPVGKVIPRTAAEFRALLTQAYSYVPSDRGLATFRSDEMTMDGTLAAEDLNSYKDIWIWNDVSPSENTTAFGWRSFYHTSFIANYVIESKEMIEEGTVDEVNQMVGESYMLRAYMHFLLVNLFGEAYTNCDPATTKAIPLKLNSDTETTLSRNTVAEVYNSILSDLVEAEKYLNYPYVWGGSNPSTSFDCSGFVSYVLTNTGLVNTGRLGAQGLYNVCTPVSRANAQPGDLIFFTGTYDTPGISHVGIYVGDNVMLHCGDPIQYTSISSSYWQSHFYAFGRPNY